MRKTVCVSTISEIVLIETYLECKSSGNKEG